MNLNQEEFKKVVRVGFSLCDALSKDYPGLKIYPVFSRFGPRSGQCALTSNPLTLLVEFPEMLHYSKAVEQLRGLILQLKWAEKFDPDSKKELEKKHNALMKKVGTPIPVTYYSDVYIEFRTKVLKYDLLAQIKKDPRLPPELNKDGNIRIIAGSLSDLLNENK